MLPGRSVRRWAGILFSGDAIGIVSIIYAIQVNMRRRSGGVQACSVNAKRCAVVLTVFNAIGIVPFVVIKRSMQQRINWMI